MYPLAHWAIRFSHLFQTCYFKFRRGDDDMKQTVGLLMQLGALSMLPAIVIFQLFYGFKLIVMPISLLTGICMFSLGTLLRESGK